MASTVTALLKLARIKQWIKNVFVLAPIVFAGAFLDPEAIANALTAFLAFCLASSVVYIINDLKDAEADSRHPTKRLSKPLASGAVTPRQAYMLLGGIALALLGVLSQLPSVSLVILAYVLMNLAYTWHLKTQPVVDIFCIATGFVMRVYAGAVAVDVPLSPWMFVTTLSLALYLAAIKRRQELVKAGDTARAVLGQYSVALVDRYAEMSATGALVFYSLYVITVSETMVMTVPFVLFGLYRYWFIVEANDAGESPTDALYTDWQLIVAILCWGGTCLWALWPSAT